MFKEKYPNKTKYLMKQNTMIGGGAYEINHNSINNAYFYNLYEFIVVPNNNSSNYYSQGAIVFVRQTDIERRLMKIGEFMEISQNFGDPINTEFCDFIKDYGLYEGFNYTELFWPCVSNEDTNCLQESHPMYFFIVGSGYNSPCESEPAYHDDPDLLHNPQDPQNQQNLIGPWDSFNNMINNIYYYAIFRFYDSLLDSPDQYDPNTRFNAIIDTRNDYILYYISPFNYIADTNNMCHLSNFIQNGARNAPNYYSTNNDTCPNWIALCNNAYQNYQNNVKKKSTFAYFRGRQVPWMHFKLRDKNEFQNIFNVNQREFYDNVIKPLLYWNNNIVGGVKNTIKIENNYMLDKHVEEMETNKQVEEMETNKQVEEMETNKQVEEIETNKQVEEIETNIPDIFEVYDIQSKELISKIKSMCKELNIDIDYRTAKLMFLKLENHILDKFTLKVLYGIDNKQFFTDLLNLYEKIFNVKTNENYKKGDLLISKLLSLRLDVTDNFIIGIKNQNIIGRLTDRSFNNIKIINKVTLSKEDQQKIFDICNSL